ncbi:microcin C transport system substrate-binding protein [Vannielia litorea]|uniref:Microcin C transport system substrate-binding protein n=2 Tax=Vannielia litorea TaxID=1217970 RepID=A0A1N6H9B1_9RHOB|nr:microcin C transport system substrate-binding protein [Vannielia litorea]
MSDPERSLDLRQIAPMTPDAANSRRPNSMLARAQGVALAVLLAAMPAVAQEQAGAEGGQATLIRHGIPTFPGGELKYGPDFEHLDYVNPEAPKGGEMSEWAFGGFDNWNPYTINGRAGALSSAPHESLLTGVSDEIGTDYGLLAESMEYPEDRSWVIFTLREGTEFSDGSPLTTEDVMFSYELFREKGLPSYREILAASVESAEVIDDRRIKFTFMPEKEKRDLIQMVGGLSIFSKAQYEANRMDLEEPQTTPWLGSGPYVVDLSRSEMGKTVVVTRNPDYWGEDLSINRGRNNFDALRVEYFADYAVALEGFKAGAYLFRNEASSKDWATGYEFPAVKNGWVVKRELAHGRIATGQSFVYNLRRTQLQDPRVREAIGLMFNFEWSNEKLFYGIYSRVSSFWENTDLAATGLPSEAELALLEPLRADIPEEVFTEEPFSEPTSDPNSATDRRNLRRANKLLDEAGWSEFNNAGLRVKDGKTLRVEFLNDSQTFDRVINPFVENLRAAGIDAVHQRVDNASATERERPPSYDFDIVTAFLQTGYIPGDGLKQYFGGETADTSTFNKMGLKNAAVDSLIESVKAAQTEEELRVATSALDRVLRALKFRTGQWHKAADTVAYYDIFEHPEELPPYALGNMDFWWYNAEKAETLKAAGAF